MPSKLQFVPPASKHPISIQFSESYRRKEKAYSNNYLKIVEPDIHERQEMKHWALKSIAKPEHVRVKLLRAWKTKIREGEFEDDDSNIVTGPKAPKVGFHYLLIEDIDNPKSLENGNPPWSFPISSNTFEVGRYKRPKFQLTTNERGDIVKSSVVGGFECWYNNADDTEEIKRVLSEYERDPTFMLGIVGADKVPRTVPCEEEWIEGSVDDLANANKGVGLGHGETYLTKEYGGLNRYLKNKEAKVKEGRLKNDDETTITTADNKNKRSSRIDTS